MNDKACSHQWKPFNYFHDIYACIHCDERVNGKELVRLWKDETPRTDAAVTLRHIERVPDGHAVPTYRGVDMVTADFARGLERELNALRSLDHTKV
jgi:hypothetical protein